MRALPIAKPCPESFETMRGNERVRHCDKCDKSVFDLSAGTEREAEAILESADKSGRICVRYAANSGGQIRFALAAAAAVSVAACSAPDQTQSLQIGPVMSQPSTVKADAGVDDTYYLLGEIDTSAPQAAAHCNANKPPHK
jgi:hypothetical protein